MPPKGKKETEKSTQKKKRKTKTVASDSENGRPLLNSESSEKEVVFSPQKGRKEKTGEIKESEQTGTNVRETSTSDNVSKGSNQKSIKKNLKESSMTDKDAKTDKRTSLSPDTPGTSQAARSLSSGELEEEELDYEDLSQHSQPEYLADRMDAETDSSINPLEKSQISDEEESSTEEKKKKKRKRVRRRSRKNRRSRKKRRKRHSSTSSSSSSDSSSSSTSSEEEDRKKAKRSRHKRSKGESKLEENVVMSRQEFLDMKSLYEKMEKFYQDHQKEEESQAGENDNSTNSNNAFDIPIQAAIPGLDGQPFRQKRQIKEVPSETTILSRMIKPIQCKSPDQIERFLTDQRKRTFPGVLGPRSSSDSEITGKRSSGERPNLLSSSDDNHDQLFADAGRGTTKGNPSGEDRLKQMTKQADWEEKIEAAKKRADKMVREAEINKAEVIKPPGRSKLINVIDQIERHVDTDRCDELASTTSAHIPKSLRQQIERGQFVELHKLRPIARYEADQERDLKLTNASGDTYYIPSTSSGAERESSPSSIYNFKTWQQCFIVYLEIYATANPTKAGEIIDYVHAIEEASNIYVWENVDKYDRLYRLHMGKFPHREWNKRYQKAYESSMKEHIAVRNLITQAKRVHPGGNKSNKKPCWRFNKHGKCFLGDKCDQEHKCNRCGLYNHGGVNCIKGKKGSESKNDKSERSDKKSTQ